MTVKVLVVDDSAFMRNALAAMLESDPEIKVIGLARDGKEAVEKVGDLHPDVVTMDIEMPVMDGLQALKVIMEKHPTPVIMVSSMTTAGAKVTLDALDCGAVDFIPKNLADMTVNIVLIKHQLIEKVKAVASKDVVAKAKVTQSPTVIPSPRPPIPTKFSGNRRVALVAIGTSTGGPKALQDLLPLLPAEFPVPIVIAQHMPANFTKPFAERLNQLSKLTVKEAEEGEPLRPGVAYIAPGRGHMKISKERTPEPHIHVSTTEDYIYRPSVDYLMFSVAEVYAAKSLGVILTGMGNDGLKGLTAMKKCGSRILAQNEATCVVYGMPKAVVEAGLADRIGDIHEIASEIIHSV